MRVLRQPRGDVVEERVEWVRGGAVTHSWGALAGEICADGLTVVVGAAGDLTDRHPLPFERVDVHVVLL
jgi:hypothetical protein